MASAFNCFCFCKMSHPTLAQSFGDLVALRKAEAKMKSRRQTGVRWAMKSRKLWYLIALSTLCLLAARIAMAQEQEPSPDATLQEQVPLPDAAGQQQAPLPDPSAQEQGPPPGAARIGVINGQVSTMRGDSGEWVAAIVNAPVMQGDTVATVARSRAEVQLDFANVLRLNENTDVKIAALTQKHIQVQVASGIIDYTVFKGSEANVEIDTPNMAVLPLGEGVYRIQINADSQTQLTVRKGKAQVSTPEGSATVERGQVIYVRGTDNPEYQIANAEPNDEWDRWNSERDRIIEQAQSWQYANRYYTGAQDLDQYGQWQNTPDYGYVWTPNVGPDWVPYYDGNWTWEPYWGWTWVSYEPWGWAPYHYGRWCWWGGRWCWWPGIGYWGPRPMWAPAFVSFLGFGFRGLGFGFGLGFGSIGWLPLGPFDRVFGWWGHRNGYTAVNITNINNINNFGRGGLRPMGNGRYMSNLQAAFTNPGIRRAITTMPAGQFGRGMSRGYGRGVDEATLRGGQMVRGTLPIVPTRASLMPGNRMASPSAIPSRAVTNTRFYSRTPVTARTESFTQRAAQIQQMVRQNPLGMSNNGVRSGANSRLGNAGGAGSGGFGNANRPGYANPRSTTPYTQGQSANSDWQRFSSRTPYSSPSQGRSGGLTSPSPQSPRSYPNGPQPGLAPQGGNQGGWQRFPGQNQPAPLNRGGGWNAPAPRTQPSAPSWGRYSYGSGARPYGGYGGRPTLNMNRPIVVPRSNAPRSYGSGGRSTTKPSGGGHGNSGGGGGGHTGSGGGGGGHSGGGGGHSGGGGGHSGGGRR